jgi:adenine-specific DNA-methyltransferase
VELFLMRYIGGKSILLDNIYSEILKADNISTVMDIFSGSGVVGNYLKTKGFNVCSNDFLYFSYVLARGTIGICHVPTFDKLNINDVVEYLNNLTLDKTDFSKEDCFIYQNYSPNENCQRMYFQNDNAIKIDIIRQQIQEWKDVDLINDDEYFYLLAMLLNAVPYVANITGTFGAYLKFWDARTYNPLTLQRQEIVETDKNIQCFHGDYTEVLDYKVDLLYADPPYNSREYLPNYHILETIARYDNPAIKGVTGIRPYQEQKSGFCKKNQVKDAFETLIRDAQARYILISYNNEGLLSTEELKELCEKYAVEDSFRLVEINYRRYKSKIPNNSKGLKEQLYFLRRY